MKIFASRAILSHAPGAIVALTVFDKADRRCIFAAIAVLSLSMWRDTLLRLLTPS